MLMNVLLFAVYVQFRFFIPTLCLDSFNGCESNLYVGVHAEPKELDPHVQYESLVRLKGSRFLDGKGGERYVGTRVLTDVKKAEAMKLHEKFERLRAEAEKYRE